MLKLNKFTLIVLLSMVPKIFAGDSQSWEREQAGMPVNQAELVALGKLTAKTLELGRRKKALDDAAREFERAKARYKVAFLEAKQAEDRFNDVKPKTLCESLRGIFSCGC